MKPIRLCVLDLDGTVLDPDQEVPIAEPVVKAVARVLERGIGVTLATGRTLEYAAPRAQALGIELPLVTSQGAVVGGQAGVLWQKTIPERAARDALAWADCSHHVVAAYSHDTIVQNKELEPPAVYDHLFGAGRVVRPDLSRALAGEPLVKFIVVNEPDIEAQLRLLMEPEIAVVRTHARLIEGTAAGVNKGSGLSKLLELLAIEPGETMVVGDNDNDLPMFALAGLSVAMGQATPAVQRAADWVAPSFYEHGVAAALERFLLDPATGS